MDMNKIAQAVKDQAAKQPIDQQIKQQIIDGTELKVHQSAEYFPLLKDTDMDAFDELCNDIMKLHKVNEAIKINSKGEILDGRNRIAAIRAIDSSVSFQVDVISVPNQHDWIISTNLHRRHLTPSQRAMIAAEMSNSAREEGKRKSTVTQKDAAQSMGVSQKSVKRAQQVISSGNTAAVADVKTGKTTVATAVANVGKAPPSRKTVSKPKGQVTPKPKVVAKATTLGLNEEEVATFKGLCARATTPQLLGFSSFITGLLKVAGGGDENKTK